MSARPLIFDEADHRYSVGGQTLPSVTTILRPLTTYENIPAAVLANKAAIGQAAHRAAELHDAGTLDVASVHEVIRPYLDAYVRFREEHDFAPVANELRVWHPLMCYAGTLDMLGAMRGEPALVDLKCTVELVPTVGPQTAGYKEAAAETPELPAELRAFAREARRYCLQLRADGTYHLEPCNDPNDWRVFLSLLTLHNFKAKHAKHYAHQR